MIKKTNKDGHVLLFLDDIREPIHCAEYMYTRIKNVTIYHDPDWNIVRTYKEFCTFIEEHGIPDLISFDHDLADDYSFIETLDKSDWYSNSSDRAYTGYDCAKFLISYCYTQLNGSRLPKYIVHSMNPVGTTNIQNLLISYINR
jgi:hypothetical protein